MNPTEILEMLKEILKDIKIKEISNGKHRKADQESKSNTTDQSNPSPRWTTTVNPITRTILVTNHTNQGAGQGTGITRIPPVITSMCGGTYTPNDYFLHLAAKSRNKWVPPGANCLAEPNIGWTPRRPDAIGLKATEVIAGEITAWRVWYWDRERKKLRSLFVDYEWPYSEPATGEPCKGFGIHAFKHYERPQLEYHSLQPEGLPVLVMGQVSLWGDVVEYEEGYLAEFARPLSIEHAEISELYGLG